MNSELATTEKARLAACEIVIRSGKSAFIEVGNALAEIRDGKLYRAEFRSFETYCKAKWGLSKAHAYRQIDAAKIAAETSPIGDKVSTDSENSSPGTTPEIPNEATARAVASVPKDDRQEVVEEAAKSGPLTAASVAKAAAKVAETKEPKPPPLDDVGQEIPAPLWEVFEQDGALRSISRDILAVRKLIASVKEQPVGAAIDLNDCESHLKHVQTNLNGWGPYAVCPYPGKDHATCRACSGRQWLTKLQWQAVPEDIREVIA